MGHVQEDMVECVCLLLRGLLGSRHPRDWPAVCGSRCSPGARKWGQDTENMELQGG